VKILAKILQGPGAMQIDCVAIKVRVLLDENAKRERIIVLQGRRFGKTFVDETGQGAEVAS
jgi:hypothetical protein